MVYLGLGNIAAFGQRLGLLALLALLPMLGWGQRAMPLRDLPSLDEVLAVFYQRYYLPDDALQLARHADGWWVQELDTQRLPCGQPKRAWLFYHRAEQTYRKLPLLGGEPAPPVPPATKPDTSHFGSQRQAAWMAYTNRLAQAKRFEAWAYDHLPRFGYAGWAEDVVAYVKALPDGKRTAQDYEALGWANTSLARAQIWPQTQLQDCRPPINENNVAVWSGGAAGLSYATYLQEAADTWGYLAMRWPYYRVYGGLTATVQARLQTLEAAAQAQLMGLPTGVSTPGSGWLAACHDQYAQNLLRNLPHGALYLLEQPREFFPVWHAQQVLGLRPDVTLIYLPWVNQTAYLQWLRYQAPLRQRLWLALPDSLYRLLPPEGLPLRTDALRDLPLDSLLSQIDCGLESGPIAAIRPAFTHLTFQLDCRLAPPPAWIFPLDSSQMLCPRFDMRADFSLNARLPRTDLFVLDLLGTYRGQRPILFSPGTTQTAQLGPYTRNMGLNRRLWGTSVSSSSTAFGAFLPDSALAFLGDSLQWAAQASVGTSDASCQVIPLLYAFSLLQLADLHLSLGDTACARAGADSLWARLQAHPPPYPTPLARLADIFWLTGDYITWEHVVQAATQMLDARFDELHRDPPSLQTHFLEATVASLFEGLKRWRKLQAALPAEAALLSMLLDEKLRALTRTLLKYSPEDKITR